MIQEEKREHVKESLDRNAQVYFNSNCSMGSKVIRKLIEKHTQEDCIIDIVNILLASTFCQGVFYGWDNPQKVDTENKEKVTMENNSKEHVNHPEWYTKHPSGVECIEVARHFCFDIGNAIKYLWRAGLKKEQGISNLEKEIEDCNKAIWYIKDHVKMLNKKLNKNEENN